LDSTADIGAKQYFVATNVSLGQYHGAVVINDIDTVKDFTPLLYAEHILNDLLEFIKQEWQRVKHGEADQMPNDDVMIEKVLCRLFVKEKDDFPHINV
jgi:hypothetical protein